MDGTPYFAPSFFPPTYFAPLPGALASDAAGPYFAPSYFAPVYFGPVATGPSPGTPGDPITPVPTHPGVGGVRYFPPTYFSAAYFGDLATDSASGPTPAPKPAGPAANPAGAVRAALDTLAALVSASGIFGAVGSGDPSRMGLPGAGGYPSAFVAWAGWADSDGLDPTSIVRRVDFKVRIAVRSDEGADPSDDAGRLAWAVESAVDGADLGGPCLPALTRIRSSRPDPTARYPELAVELDGEFSLLLDPEVFPLD